MTSALHARTLLGIVLASVFATTLFPVICASAAPSPQTNIELFAASTTELPSSGGSVIVTGSLANPLSCVIAVNPLINNFGGPLSCATGAIETTVMLPANTTTAAIPYSITLTDSANSDNWASETIVVTVSSAIPSMATQNFPMPVGNTVSVPAEPDALVNSGANLWVASCSTNTVTEISDVTKQIVRELNGQPYGFNCPDAIVSDGTNIWVANGSTNPQYGTGSVTEFNASNGNVVRILAGSDINGPLSLTIANSDLWIGNESNITPVRLSEFELSTGSLVRVLIPAARGSAWSVVVPSCITFTGQSLWVSDELSSAAWEFSASTGAFLRHTVYTGPGNVTLSSVACVSYDDGYLWADGSNNSVVVEYNARTGAYVRSIKNVFGPDQLIFNGSRLLVIVTNPKDVVKEYNSKGKFLRNVATAGQFGGKGFSAISLEGATVWTANYTNASVSAWKL